MKLPNNKSIVTVTLLLLFFLSIQILLQQIKTVILTSKYYDIAIEACEKNCSLKENIIKALNPDKAMVCIKICTDNSMRATKESLDQEAVEWIETITK